MLYNVIHHIYELINLLKKIDLGKKYYESRVKIRRKY